MLKKITPKFPSLTGENHKTGTTGVTINIQFPKNNSAAIFHIPVPQPHQVTQACHYGAGQPWTQGLSLPVPLHHPQSPPSLLPTRRLPESHTPLLQGLLHPFPRPSASLLCPSTHQHTDHLPILKTNLPLVPQIIKHRSTI